MAQRGEYRLRPRHATQAVSVEFDHPWHLPRMESRMQGNLHVRFGAGDEETCPGDGARRFIPTLPADPAELSLSIERRQPGAGGNEPLACGLAPHPGMSDGGADSA